MILYLDTETFSEVPISRGTFAYAEAAEIMIVTYALDDGTAKVWDLTDGGMMPNELKLAVEDPAVFVVMHNSVFDRAVLRYYLKIDIPVSRVIDTMAMARSHSLPGGLDKLGGIMNVGSSAAKLKSGKSLIHLFCKPQPANRKLRRATRDTHPAEWAAFIAYALRDIEATRALYKKLPRWNYPDMEQEYRFWQIDSKINERGVGIDLSLVDAAIRATNRAKARLSEETAELTGGEVQSTTQRDRTLAYMLREHGVALDDLRASTIKAALTDERLPSEVRELLGLRAEASLSSVAKYRRFQEAVSKDGRLRGMFIYCGASRTGRFSGNVVQLQNLRRPTLRNDEIDIGIAALKAEMETELFPRVMDLAGSAVRGVLVPAAGRKFLIADLANIEGRVCAWLSGEDWKLAAYRAYDAKTGPDLYKMAYARAFRVSPDGVTKYQRQVGKVLELMLQYQGGVGAFVTGAATVGIDLDELARAAWDTLPEKTKEEAATFWEVCVKEGKTSGLTERPFIVCDSLKRLWREAHPGICSLWVSVEDFFLAAYHQPGVWHSCGRLAFRRDRAWLRVKLPSGRMLCYPSVQVDGGFSYAGTDPFTREWGRVNTYGGKIVENIVQAVSRDILAQGILAAEFKGLPVVLHAHDEIVSEVPDTEEYEPALLEACMTGVSWAEGLPLAAEGYEADRYRKE